MPIPVALILMVALMISALVLGRLIGLPFLAVLGGYFVLTSVYSTWLKKKAIADVMVLSILYTVRIVAGSFAVGVAPSVWLLLYSLLLFFSLSLLKRYGEVQASVTEQIPGRDYRRSDGPVLLSLGSAAGVVSVLVVGLYVESPATAMLYESPMFLWVIVPVLFYCVLRWWLIAHRGNMHDDPVVFVMRDRVSWVSGVVILAAGIAAGPLLIPS